MYKKHFNKHYASRNKNIDCVVKYDPDGDSIETLSLRILQHLFINRLKYNKPVILGVFGKSGEGKSESTASMIEELMAIQNLSLTKHFDIINCFTPAQYSDKLHAIMFDKKYKEIKTIIIHEAREVVKAKNWFSFINIAISDINAMARSVKRIMTVVISQGLMDIDKSMRGTLTHYAKVERPNNPQLNAKMFLRIVYEDDTFMERPILKRRKPRILLIYPNKKCRTLVPNYIEIPRASKEIQELLKRKDNEAKVPLIKRKLHQIQEEIKKEWGEDTEKERVKGIIDFYTASSEKFTQIMVKSGGRWTLDKSFENVLGLKKEELKIFKSDIIGIAKKKGFIESKKEIERFREDVTTHR